MRPCSNWVVESLVSNLNKIHEFLPSRSHLVTICHPSHWAIFLGVKVDRSIKLSNEFWIKIILKGHEVLNPKLLYQIQSLGKVSQVIGPPHVGHVHPMSIHVQVGLALEYLCVEAILLLGPKKFIPMKLSSGFSIRVVLPPCHELISWHLFHSHRRFLLLVGGGLELALGIGALWNITGGEQTLGPGVTDGIGATNIGTGATT